MCSKLAAPCQASRSRINVDKWEWVTQQSRDIDLQSPELIANGLTFADNLPRVFSIHRGMTMRIVLVVAGQLLIALSSLAAIAGERLPTATPEQVGLSASGLAEVDSAMKKYVDEEKLAGVVVLIARHGKVAHADVYGSSDIEGKKPIQRDSLFRIYSMPKPITGVALMTLYDEGRFQLDDPVSKYLPGFAYLKVYEGKKGDEVKLADLKRPITIRDLMCHTSGLAYGIFPLTPVDGMYTKAKLLDHTQNLDSMLDRLLKLPLAAQPGDRWMYSISVDVQGKLIEALSGEKLDAFFAKRIFEPLGMHDTGFFVPADKLDRFTVNYGPKDGHLAPIDSPTTSQFSKPPALLSGGGGLVSTADDYLQFAQMMLNRGELNGKRILKAETVDLMTKNHLPDKMVPISIGPLALANLGFGLDVSVRVKTDSGEPASAIGEYGWGGAASTQFFVSPGEDLICVAMTQLMPVQQTFSQEARKLLYKAIEKPNKP